MRDTVKLINFLFHAHLSQICGSSNDMIRKNTSQNFNSNGGHAVLSSQAFISLFLLDIHIYLLPSAPSLSPHPPILHRMSQLVLRARAELLGGGVSWEMWSKNCQQLFFHSLVGTCLPEWSWHRGAQTREGRACPPSSCPPAFLCGLPKLVESGFFHSQPGALLCTLPIPNTQSPASFRSLWSLAPMEG